MSWIRNATANEKSSMVQRSLIISQRAVHLALLSSGQRHQERAMFGTLFESHAVMQRRTGSSIASILIHSAIITGGVIATARDIVAPPSEPPVMHMVPFMRPVGPPIEHRGADRVSTAAIMPAPIIQRLTVPSIVPVGLPPVSLEAGPMPFEFGPRAVRAS